MNTNLVDEPEDDKTQQITNKSCDEVIDLETKQDDVEDPVTTNNDNTTTTTEVDINAGKIVHYLYKIKNVFKGK